jgi:hypothetical protein
MSTTTLVATAAMVVPERLLLTPTMKAADWSTTPLIPIDFTIGVQELEPILSAQDVISKHMGSAGSIAYVVRRPG